MKRMKKTLYLAMFAAMFAVVAMAQPTQRTADTKIVDALNQLPAGDVALYNRLMADIESTGSQGVEMLIAMLDRSDDSRVKVEYALDAFAAYAGSPAFDAGKRQALVQVVKKHLDAINAKLTGNAAQDAAANPWAVTNRELLVRMLRHLNQYPSKPADEELPGDAEALAALKKATAAAKAGGHLALGNRCKALTDYVRTAGVTAAQKIVLKALKDANREYRMTAISCVNEYGSKQEIATLLKQAEKQVGKLGDDVKVDVLYWMGLQTDLADAQVAVPLLKHKNPEVVNAAAWTITRIGKADNMNDIAALLKDNATAKLAEKCLKSYPGKVTDAVIEACGENLTVEALNIMASRKDNANSNLVFNALKSQDKAVKAAAYKALPEVVRLQNLDALYAILENCETTYESDAQRAVLSAVADMDRAKQFETVMARRAAVAKDKQNKYWPIALTVADNQKLLALARDFAAQKNTDLQDKALSAYMKTITKDIPGAQRLLMLRNAMELSRTDAQRNAILAAVGKTNTFLGVIYAGKYMDNAATAQAAAQAVRVLTSGHSEINGPEIRALMEKAKKVISGADDIYQKTEIEQQLEKLAKEDNGYVSMFNGKDLTGWKGLLASPYDNPHKRATLKAKELAKLQQEADENMRANWSVQNGEIIFGGKGRSLASEKLYGNFEMYVDWKLYPGPEPDAGIYLRGTPQVQIWDIARTNVGAQVGSGGLYNNKKNRSTPLKVADNPVGEWNSFYIKMMDERVTVYLNGELVVDNVVLENYWNRSLPLMLKEQIELQAHGSVVAYRDLYIHELPQAEPYTLSAQEKKEGFKLLFDGTSLNEWQGDLINYMVEDGTISVKPRGQGFGNLYTKEEYKDFIFRFEFKLTPGANNGVGIRAEMGKDAAYYGMEIQILDHFNKIYQPGLHDYQYHGSVYGIIPTHDRNKLKPLGEWNVEEIYVKGTHVRVTLNGSVITEGDIKEATKDGTYDKKNHPGLFNEQGYIGFLGHGSELWLRNIRVKRL